MVGDKLADGVFGEFDGTAIHCRHVEQSVHHAEAETVFLREDGSALHIFDTHDVKDGERLIAGQ